MYTACTYEEIEEIERTIENREIVIFLFVKSYMTNILQEFEYLHYNSENYCSIYAIGYTDDVIKRNDDTFRKVEEVHMKNDWYFSVKVFNEFKERLQDRINWKYSGETEVLLLQNNPGQRNSLSFQNYVAINIDYGISQKYIESFQSFMEALIRNSKSRETAQEVIHAVQQSRISVRGILSEAISECKRVPTPIRRIIKEKQFYRSANSIRNRATLEHKVV